MSCQGLPEWIWAALTDNALGFHLKSMGAWRRFLKADQNNWAHLTIHSLLLGMPVAVQSCWMPCVLTSQDFLLILLQALLHVRLARGSVIIAIKKCFTAKLI